MKKSIAVIGGGIVGSTLSFYLTHFGHQVDLYDDDFMQATQAAVGIICPWISKRRNQHWKNLVFDGAEFYEKLIRDLKDDSFYRQQGVLVFGHEKMDELYQTASKAAINTPMMKEVVYLSKEESRIVSQGLIQQESILIKGGAQVDGSIIVQVLRDKAASGRFKLYHKSVYVSDIESDYDVIVLCAGSRLNEQFNDNWTVDVRPQKGQLVVTDIKLDRSIPVMMPKGELDFLINSEGNLVVGASHEDIYLDKEIDKALGLDLIQRGSEILPVLDNAKIIEQNVGFRGFTSDYLPFYGRLNPQLYVAGGLGSSGLTSGPIIGYRLALAIHEDRDLNSDDVRKAIKEKNLE